MTEFRIRMQKQKLSMPLEALTKGNAIQKENELG